MVTNKKCLTVFHKMKLKITSKRLEFIFVDFMMKLCYSYFVRSNFCFMLFDG